MAELEDDFFGGFGICDDSDEDEKVKPTKSYKTFADIAKKIGSFHRWSELAPELKMNVIIHLDFSTRTRLSLCSKNDYDVVNSAPISIFKVEVKDTGDDDYYITREPIENITVRIQFGKDYNPNKQLHFIKRGNDTEIGWLKRFKSRTPVSKFHKLEGQNHYEEAVKFVEKLLKLARFSLKSLTVEMEQWPLETSTIQYLSQCDDIRVCNKNERFLEWWLRKVRPNLKSLQIYSSESENQLSTEFFETDHFKMSDIVHIWGYADFTDEQFLNMTASRINVESNTITDQVINQFIKNWVNGKVRENFQYFTIWVERTVVKDEILKSITFRPWDEHFEDKLWGFCNDWVRLMGRGDCNQIDKGDGSFISATLDIKHDRIKFAVTGTRMEHQGRIYTSYSMPRGV